MKLFIKRKYYKQSKIGREPIKFRVKQPKGIGTDVYGEMRIDPILRKKRNRDLHKALIKHELNEIKNWGEGGKRPHTKAKLSEPKMTRKIGGVSGFWKEIKRRGLA